MKTVNSEQHIVNREKYKTKDMDLNYSLFTNDYLLKQWRLYVKRQN